MTTGIFHAFHPQCNHQRGSAPLSLVLGPKLLGKASNTGLLSMISLCQCSHEVGTVIGSLPKTTLLEKEKELFY